MSLRTLTRHEIEKIALKVAAILKDRIDPAFGCDPENPYTWMDAGRGICAVCVKEDWKFEYGACWSEPGADDEPQNVIIVGGFWQL